MITRRVPIAISVVFLTFTTTVPAPEAKAELDCPLVSVSCPLQGKQPLVFTATVKDAEPNKTITYFWKLSKGRIASGQGTQTITIDESLTDTRGLTATLEVGGLPESCGNKASCTLSSH